MLFWKRKHTDWSGADRRREPRQGADDEFLVEVSNEHHKKPRLGAGRDISRHGIRFAVNEHFKKGEDLQLELYLPPKFSSAHRKLSLEARVVRIYRPEGTHRFRVGCELVYSDPESERVVSEFVRWLAEKPH